MATGPGFPGSTNVYVPNWAASGRLAVAYSRNVKKFPILKWIQMVESPKNQGYYLKLSDQEAARVVSLNDYTWSWGSERPTHPEGLEQFNFVPFITDRKDSGFNLDDDTERQAEWDVIEEHAKIHAAKMMTIRAIKIIVPATTASNYQTAADPDLSANHTGTATAFVGGYLDQGTSVSPFVKIFVDKAQIAIDLDTIGTVEANRLHMVMNPNTARLLAEAPEIHDYIKSSPEADHEIRTGNSPNAKYGPGLPSTLYGMDVVVDNTVQVTSRKGATLARSYVFPDQTILVAGRPGELEGVYGTPSFSTVIWFWYRDEMTVESFKDSKNRRTENHVVDCGVAQVVSPLSGWLLTSATSKAA